MKEFSSFFAMENAKQHEKKKIHLELNWNIETRRAGLKWFIYSEVKRQDAMKWAGIEVKGRMSW